MKTELFSKFMENYIPYMRRRHLYHVNRVNDEKVIFFDPSDLNDQECYEIQHTWTDRLNNLQHIPVCLITEKNNVYLIADIDNAILCITYSVKENEITYTYQGWHNEDWYNVSDVQEECLEEIFDEFADIYEEDPKNRLLFVTGQMEYQYDYREFDL